jgi:diguanylate cyclase (GGDEF)-like protein
MKSKNSMQGIRPDLFRTIMESEFTYVFFKDRQSRFINVSLGQSRGFNCASREEVIGKTDYDFFSEAMRDEQKIVETGVPILNKIERIRWLTGDVSWVQVNKYPLYDEQKNIIGTWGMSYNVTALTDEKRQLEEDKTKLVDMGNFYKRQCVIDDMTELFNRRKFFEDLDSEYAKIKKTGKKRDEFCISFLDIDNFKKVNDRYGHQFGDFLISQTAAKIRANVRADDIVFRYGGDEFLILYKQTGKEDALAITERIRTVIGKARFTRGGKAATLTISGGVASSSEAGSVDALTHIADMRLYSAKSQGKDNIAC